MSQFSRIAFSTLALITATAVQADNYSWTEGAADPRAFYTDFSDSEFVSLKPAPTALPIVLDTWRNDPIPSTVFIVPPLRVTRDADVQRQKLALNQPDPAFRSRIVSILADGQSPKSAPILIEQLNTEKDTRTRADLMVALKRLKAPYPTERLMNFAKAPLAAERAAALGLYLAQTGSDRALLWEAVASDPALQVQLAALRSLAESPQPDEKEKWFTIAKEPPVQSADSIAIRALLETSGMQANDFTESAQGTEPAFPTAIAQQLPGTFAAADAASLIKTLLAHPHSSVQSASCLAANRVPSPAHQADLIRLTESPVSEVRRAAAEALQQHPTQAAMDALVQLAGDEKSILVRRRARTSLETISAKFSVADQLPKLVDDASELRREQIFLLSKNIGAQTAGAELSARLDKEPNPVNLTALVQAISIAHHAASADAIFALADHESNIVRGSVAFAIGNLPIPSQRAKLNDYVQIDRSDVVRAAAFRSMAVIGTDEFDEALLAILKRTNYAASGDKAEYLTSKDRELAAWTASRTKTLSSALIKRLIQQVTHMVIKTELGPTHDSGSVRLSCALCLVQHLKKLPDDKSLKRAAKEVLRVLSSETPINNAPVDPVTNHFGNQAQAWLDGTPIDRSYPRTLRYRMLFEPLPKRRTPTFQ